MASGGFNYFNNSERRDWSTPTAPTAPYSGFSTAYNDGMYTAPNNGLYPTPNNGSFATPSNGFYPTPNDGLYPTPYDGFSTPNGFFEAPDNGFYSTPNGFFEAPDNGFYSTQNGFFEGPDNGFYSTQNGFFEAPDNGFYPTPNNDFFASHLDGFFAPLNNGFLPEYTNYGKNGRFISPEDFKQINCLKDQPQASNMRRNPLSNRSNFTNPVNILDPYGIPSMVVRDPGLSNCGPLPTTSNYVSTTKKPAAESKEFKISNEDFPTLPGAAVLTPLSIPSKEQNTKKSRGPTASALSANSASTGCGNLSKENENKENLSRNMNVKPTSNSNGMKSKPNSSRRVMNSKVTSSSSPGVMNSNPTSSSIVMNSMNSALGAMGSEPTSRSNGMKSKPTSSASLMNSDTTSASGDSNSNSTFGEMNTKSTSSSGVTNSKPSSSTVQKPKSAFRKKNSKSNYSYGKKKSRFNSTSGAVNSTLNSSFDPNSAANPKSDAINDISNYESRTVISKSNVGEMRSELNATSGAENSLSDSTLKFMSNVTSEATHSTHGAKQSTETSCSNPQDMSNSMSNQVETEIETTLSGQESNIQPSLITDQFGLLGLAAFIRGAESCPNSVPLTVEIDLETLGIDMNSDEYLYESFSSPWDERPCRPQDIDYSAPDEYLIFHDVEDYSVAPVNLKENNDDVLMYLFYDSTGDILQLAAAAELYERGWRYHIEERIWLMGSPENPLFEETEECEIRSFYFFDIETWSLRSKELNLDGSKLEGRPTLPPDFVGPVTLHIGSSFLEEAN